MLGKREQGAQNYVFVCVKPLPCVTFHLMVNCNKIFRVGVTSQIFWCGCLTANGWQEVLLSGSKVKRSQAPDDWGLLVVFWVVLRA